MGDVTWRLVEKRIGKALANKLKEGLPGAPCLYIPTFRRVHPDHKLLTVLTPLEAKQVCQQLNGLRLSIPKPRRMCNFQRIRQQWQQGYSMRRLAQEHQVTYGYIWEIVRGRRGKTSN